MVCYCCVKGCKNNNRIKRKDHNSKITFHALPSKADLKAKWLKAIGRPHWEPPLHTRVCSIHFDNNQIKREGYRTRIKDDACPTLFLPVNSNFEATGLKVCRICLATDIKMYSLQEGVLKSCIEVIHGLIENINIEGMPPFVCYECRACLIKFYQLLEKSMIAQATLLDIFAIHGKLSMNLIKKQDRTKLNLNSSLSCYKPNHIYKYMYDDGDDKYLTIKRDDYIVNNDDEYFKCDDNKSQIENKFTSEPWDDTIKSDVINQTEKIQEEITCDNTYYINSDDPTDTKESVTIANEIEYISGDNEVLDDFESYVVIEVKNEKQISSHNELDKRSNIKKKSKSNNRLTHIEVNMKEHFDVVKLSLQEQIEEWKKARETTTITSETVYKCEICSKIFAHMSSYHNHIAGHDPSRGKEECPVCKLRFKSKLQVQLHRRVHRNKFYCKLCPKVFNTMTVARKHYRWHTGHRYKCSWCTFTSAHESAVGTHVRTTHARVPGAYTCTRCGLTCCSERGLALHRSIAHKHQPELEVTGKYKCEPCDLYFASEGARRLHLLTTRHDRTITSDSTSPGDSGLINTCDKCNKGFTSLVDLKQHIATEHQNGVETNTTGRERDKSRPTLCEHCGESMKSRKEHYLHIIRQHPKEKHLYQPVITAVCEICGKGFQNSTKLHLHELRHSQPTVKCDYCPRLFYDKYAAAIHRTVHETAKPYACRTCGRTFKLKGNLYRHSRVHSSVAAYECPMCEKKFKYSYSVNLHVRTVHHKMPYPSRKKRKLNRTAINSPDNTTTI